MARCRSKLLIASKLLAVAAVAASLCAAVWAAEEQHSVKGVSSEDAQHLQSLIDAYRRQDPLVVKKLKNDLYLAKGGPAGNDPNTGFVVGESSVILIDNKNRADAQKAVLDEIAKITPKPVKTVVLLHSDNETGIGSLPEGMTIIAQENTKKEMEVATGRNAIPPNYFPTKTIDQDESEVIDGIRIRMLHWAPAHTSGDLIVYLPAEKVVFAGDVIVADFPPGGTQIHPNLHGSAAGWIETVKGMLALDADAYVPGHGDVFTKADVRTKLLIIEDKWNQTKTMIAQGKSLDEIKGAFGEPTEPPQRNAQGNLPPPTTTEIMYAELTQKEAR
jgi:glyoxylase-like metal-dependent hydrolase (beta-lactamase superfamily II)